MVYLKSTIAGILTVLLVFVVLPAIAVSTILVVLISIRGSDGFGIDVPGWQVHSPVFWLVAIATFGAGYFWEFRRLSR